MKGNNNEKQTVSVVECEIQKIKEISEARRLAMCDVYNLLRFMFGEQGIPQKKSQLLRRVTQALMNTDDLERYLSRFDENCIEKFKELCREDL